MQINLNQIQLYSSCPRKFGFVQSVPPTKQEDNIFKTIIKQCYINRSQHGYDPQWETIKTRVNRHYFADVDIKDKEAFSTAYKQSLATITVLHYWYHKTFMSDNRHGIVNIPLGVQVSNSTIVASVDIILLDQKYGPVPLIFSDNYPSLLTLHNDIKFKTLLWLIWKETTYESKKTEFAITTSESIKYTSIYNKSSMDTIEKYVNFIVRGIENKVYYPSVNTQCNSCEYAKICVI
jgi:CRISPR/Cas system-associated exonuclease Cas4 (RecB family)